jgi:hypothetical protein
MYLLDTVVLSELRKPPRQRNRNLVHWIGEVAAVCCSERGLLALPVQLLAQSAVMPVVSSAMCSMRVRGTSIFLASAPADSLSDTRNSSRGTSPGCMGASFLVIADVEQTWVPRPAQENRFRL